MNDKKTLDKLAKALQQTRANIVEIPMPTSDGQRAASSGQQPAEKKARPRTFPTWTDSLKKGKKK